MERNSEMRLPSLAILVASLSALFQGCATSERIAFLGDSITEEGNRPGGYVDLIRQRLKNSYNTPSEVIGAGISGNKVTDLQARLEKDILSKTPNIVVIYIGINDVWHYQLGIGGTSAERYEAGLRDILARTSAGGARVVLCTPTVVGEKSDGTNPLDAMLDKYSDITRAVGRSTGTLICDLRKAIIAELKQRNSENKEKGVLTRDGVHLNEAGNRFVAEEILKALNYVLRGN